MNRFSTTAFSFITKKAFQNHAQALSSSWHMSSVKDHSVGALQKAELRNERSLVAEVWWRPESLKPIFCVEQLELNGSKNNFTAKGHITLRRSLFWSVIIFGNLSFTTVREQKIGFNSCECIKFLNTAKTIDKHRQDWTGLDQDWSQF